jgi:alginate O-acetyltransferase complex protein AlgI
MLFNSYVFLFAFLPLAWLAVWLAGRLRSTSAVLVTLIAASLVFYSYWNPKFVLLLLASVAFNYAWGRLLQGTHSHSRLLLALGIGVNLSVLGYFKYTNFFLDNLARVVAVPWARQDIFLPLGISFFTFQQIAYLADCHTRAAGPCSLLHYAAFVTFFPQLIAGPIVRHRAMMPQYRSLRLCAVSSRNIGVGLGYIALGLFKKTVIADSLSVWVNDAFGTTDLLTLVEAWGAALGYTLQIYFDFSAYSDIAIGVARLFNIRLPLNFDSPYKATSIIDFWRRWHMTLSRFLRDYLYIPLGGSRRGLLRQYVNLLATMLLAGLWHGAAWTFVLWGGLHGVLLSLNHLLRRLGRRFAVQTPAWAGWCLTFACVSATWVFFRAESMSQAVSILKGMVGLNGFALKGGHLPKFLVPVLQALGATLGKPPTWHYGGPHERNFIIFAMVLALALPNTWQWARQSIGRKPTPVTAVFVGLVLCTAVLYLGKVSEFIYFQF